MKIYKIIIITLLILSTKTTVIAYANFDVINTPKYKEYENFAKELKKEQDKRIDNVIIKEQLSDKESNNSKDINHLLNSYAPNWRSLNTGTPLKQSKPINEKIKEKTIPLIFISFSMPEELIREYIKDAKKYSGTLVLRGLIDNSIKRTVQKLREIENISTNSENQKSNLSIIIHPHLFKLYNIKQVPAIVLGEDNMGCILKYDDCAKSYKYDKISGSITIKYALEQIKDNGDLNTSLIAQYFLKETYHD